MIFTPRVLIADEDVYVTIGYMNTEEPQGLESKPIRPLGERIDEVARFVFDLMRRAKNKNLTVVRACG
jgi:hypothetical protein